MSGNDSQSAAAQGDAGKPAADILNDAKKLEMNLHSAKHFATLVVAEMMQIADEMQKAQMPPTTRKDVNDVINPAWGSLYLLADETPELVKDQVDGNRIVYTDMLNFNIDEATIQVKDGVLTADAIPAAAMVQKYGSMRVLKCPDQLKAAVQFARQLPITDDHPKEDEVTSQKDVKGWSSLLTWDEATKAVCCKVEITDAPLIEKVQNGKRGMSIGFHCELDMNKGKYGDEDYDAKQVDIMLNHIAIVDQGRCPMPRCALGMKPKKKDEASAADAAPAPVPDPKPAADAAPAPAPAPTDEEKAAAEAKSAEDAKLKKETEDKVALELHQKLLDEKVAAVKAAAEKLAAGVATMTQEEFSKTVSAIESLSWDMRKLRETLAGTGATGVPVLEKADTAIKESDAVLARAKADLATFTALIDKVMDSEPPFTRDFAEKRPRSEIDTLVKVSAAKPKPFKASDSSAVKDMADAYLKRVKEVTGG